MVKPIIISTKSQSLIEALRHMEDAPTLLQWTLNSKNEPEIDFSEVLAWLNKNESHDKPIIQKARFERESLRATLLHDLYPELLKRIPLHKISKKTEKSGWRSRGLFILLATAGTMLALCDGFDGVTSILSLFIGIPMWLVFLAGFAFSLLSLTVFYGFDLVQISQNLGVEFSQSSQMIDIFVDQVDQIKLIRKAIKQLCDEKNNTAAELLELKQLSTMLNHRHNSLDKVRATYTSELQKPYLKGLKLVVAIIAGLLFFSYGFFSGQSLAIAVLSLFMTSVSLTLWPVILISVLMGVAAFSVYWFVERPGLENLVGSWLGFDQDKITRLTDEDIVEKEKRKLNQLLELTEPRPSGSVSDVVLKKEACNHHPFWNEKAASPPNPAQQSAFDPRPKSSL